MKKTINDYLEELLVEHKQLGIEEKISDGVMLTFLIDIVEGHIYDKKLKLRLKAELMHDLIMLRNTPVLNE